MVAGVGATTSNRVSTAVLDSVGHIGMGTAVQDDAFC